MSNRNSRLKDLLRNLAAEFLNLQSQKTAKKRVAEGSEFGSQIQSKINIIAGDVIESFILVEK